MSQLQFRKTRGSFLREQWVKIADSNFITTGDRDAESRGALQIKIEFEEIIWGRILEPCFYRGIATTTTRGFSKERMLLMIINNNSAACSVVYTII